MIQPLNSTQLSSAKPRAGLQRISDLLPRLIAQYELQAQAKRQIEQDNRRRARMNSSARPKASNQTTFGW